MEAPLQEAAFPAQEQSDGAWALGISGVPLATSLSGGPLASLSSWQQNGYFVAAWSKEGIECKASTFPKSQFYFIVSKKFDLRSKNN